MNNKGTNTPLNELVEAKAKEFEKTFSYLYPSDSTIYQGQIDFLRDTLHSTIRSAVEGVEEKIKGATQYAFCHNDEYKKASGCECGAFYWVKDIEDIIQELKRRATVPPPQGEISPTN